MRIPYYSLPVLQSPFRFILKPYNDGDRDDFARLLTDERLWRDGYQFGDSHPRTIDEAHNFISRRFDTASVLFSVFSKDQHGNPGNFVGTTGLTFWFDHLERVRVGRTVLDPDLWGTGANHEIKIALLDWLFQDCAVVRIECDVDEMNVRSEKSLTNFGFTREGVHRSLTQREDSGWKNITILSLLTDEWSGIREKNLTRLANRFNRDDRTAMAGANA